MNVNVIVAVETRAWGIGLGGRMAWPALGSDLSFFQKVTSGVKLPGAWNAVVMGRTTWESLPVKPLPNRLNIVLTKTAIPDVLCATSLEDAIRVAEAYSTSTRPIESLYVIGGRQPILAALRHNALHAVFVTTVEAETGDGIPCDVFLPEVNTLVLDNLVGFRHVASSELVEQGYKVTFRECISRRDVKPHDEIQYLTLVREVLETGSDRDDRTKVGTLSKFGAVMRFSLVDGTLPLLTTKAVFWRGVVEELLWFVSGCTDAKVLSAKGVRIWDGNGSREFLDSRGLTDRAIGDLGPVYGFQWRHFGAAYGTAADDYTGAGVDQLKAVIHAIQTDPTSRRIVMSAWNPADLPKMALPPCHMFCQFYVDGVHLDCQMYQRSADLGLGVPFNVASYALLTHMVAHVCGLQAREFIHVIGDAHVYKTHMDGLREQLSRTPRPFPRLTIVGNEARDIDGFSFDSFVVEGYDPHPTIKLPMAV